VAVNVSPPARIVDLAEDEIRLVVPDSFLVFQFRCLRLIAQVEKGCGRVYGF
jgi:hypothetical protein